MAKTEPRRSQRLGTYDSNGRDYLSTAIGWTRERFEEWIYSTDVRPHLQKFYIDCIADSRRFNDAVDWINTGPNGYYYNESDLEEDLLLMCLCAGGDGRDCESTYGGGVNFNDNSIDIQGWITQEIWAKAAWRITHANCSHGQVFQHVVKIQPAVAYGFSIEMLCIIFHSIAYRGPDSVYMSLLKCGKTSEQVTDVGNVSSIRIEAEYPEEFTTATSSESSDHESDATFTERKGRAKAVVTPSSECLTIIVNMKARRIGQSAKKIKRKTQHEQHEVASLGMPSSINTAGRSSVEDGNGRAPETPNTSVSLLDGRMLEEDEVSKDEWVRGWLQGKM